MFAESQWIKLFLLVALQDGYMHWDVVVVITQSLVVSSQSSTQHHYSTYDEGHLQPIMQHISKNLMYVNEEKVKLQVTPQYC